MKYLYIDTSSNYLYTGIVSNNKLLIEVKERLDHNLSKDSVPLISKMFEKTNIQPKDINKIIVVDGPGSFTGIRIGITIAKVYAHSMNIPITTISSLEAMALSTNKENYLVPVIDARRDYVYTAIYDNEMNEILKPTHIELNKLQEELEKIEKYTIISNDNIDRFGTPERYDPNIEKIVLKYKDKENMNPHEVNPNYLKLTEAEEKLRNND